MNNSHVRICSNSEKIENAGTKAEVETLMFLLDNLNMSRVGDYQILFNYNLPYVNRGGRGTLELDLVVITQLGVFPIEVKDYHGSLVAHDGSWEQNQKYKLKDFFAILENKARVLYGRLVEKAISIPAVDKTSVTPIIVLFQGKKKFSNQSENNITLVTGLDNDLIEALSSNRLLRKGSASRMLSNEEIKQIADSLYDSNGQQDHTIIGSYRVVGELSPGNTYEAYEGLHNEIPNKRARIKVFKLPLSPGQFDLEKIKRDAIVISKLGFHSNLVQTYDFIQDPSQANIFYEITEPVQGSRLDEFLQEYEGSLSLDIQLNCIEQLCRGIIYAHEKGVYHRNISPETIYIIHGDIIKLADFDYAKIVGEQTLYKPGETMDAEMQKSIFVAPELKGNPHLAASVSDIYSLGAVWYLLASLPNKSPAMSPHNVDALNLPIKVRALLKSMIEPAPANRPQSIKRILEKIQDIKSESGNDSSKMAKIQ